ncbi:type II toxin-antitoxin system VapC family toxin [Amaricoccus solimangrovi]|uniref:Ribonuclease VapC n=1 Tax=Amaricoccus solimangrovi TaxID=2589815 RepID=A0A501WGG7_9RHOB|nr:type II toxin-antitoxin system VapC family toxin [Amaricoccus solimangrovi]TPE47882.1 type II toxin-antitoxin system VapC family toxin [Amaricoccus solimangrovi]
MFLVDTNIVSEARRGTAEAVSWLRQADPSAIYLSVLTIGEIMRGIELRRRRDPRAAAHLAQWLASLRRDFSDRVLSVTPAVAVEWGRIAAIRPRGDIDGLIAATAIVHDLIVVTRNVKDFDDTGAIVLDPWASA